MKKTVFSFIVFFSVFQLCIFGQVPDGYYNSIDGKQERELKTAVHQAVKAHTTLNYGASAQSWGDNYFKQADWHPEGYYWDMYSPEKYVRYDSSVHQREHCMPNSWWGGESGSRAAYSDLHNLYPSEGSANNAKSNYPLGKTAGERFNNGVSKVGTNTYAGYSGIVFEPANEYKGDFARVYMYMVTCYEDLSNRWSGTSMLQNNTYPTLNVYAVNLLLEWHRNDPVSEKEINRNNAVYRLQSNRNPFIDEPELAEHIWGNKKSEVFRLGGGGEEPPVHNVYIAGGLLQIDSLDGGGEIRIYNLQGILLSKICTSAGTVSLPLPSANTVTIGIIDNAGNVSSHKLNY
jgi:endonuclease I